MVAKLSKFSIKILIFTLTCTLFILCQNISTKASNNQKNVLFISSYTESYEAVPQQIQGINDVLSPKGIHTDYEFMDTKRFDTDKNIDLFYHLLKYKLDNTKPYDALIAGDDRALQFAIDYKEELFPNLPIIFLGVNDIARAESAAKDPNITGIIEKISIKENIELALKFNPDANRVVAFVDNTLTGIGDMDQFFSSQKYFPHLIFNSINSSDYTFDELTSKIEECDSNTIMLYLGMFKDKNGTYYTIHQISEMFKKYAKVPVYRTTVGGVGDGILGGKMVSFQKSGNKAANMVLKIFAGTPVKDIPLITESPNYYILDYKLLKKYNLNPDLAPKGTKFINKKASFYEQHKRLVWTMIIIISCLSIFIIILIINNLKYRSIKNELTQSHEHLTQANEELTATEEELKDQNLKIQEHLEQINLLNERFELSVNSTNSTVWEFNHTTDTISFSDNVQSILGNGINLSEIKNDFITKVFDKNAGQLITDEFMKYLSHEKEEINIQLPVKTPDSSTKWILIRGKGICSTSGEYTLLHGIIIDTTKLKEQEMYIEHLANYDYLTNLPNRLLFMEKLNEKIKLGNPLAIVMFDIDNFKEINDTLGHVYGDLLLKDIADRLISLQTDNLLISRFGGDEFLILISDEIGQEIIEKHIQTIKNTFKKPLHIGHREHFIEFSMGISRYPLDCNNIHQLIMNADTAMHRVKHSGKNNHQFYDESMQEVLKERARIETILRRALKEDSYYLVYQPIVNVIDGEIIGFEALLRLKDNIPPSIFIPIAEESDIILEIGRRVTVNAINQISKWLQKGYPPKKVSINFSSKQIKDNNYINFLKTTLETYSVDPKYLNIEITESILLDETGNTIEFLNKLRDLGVNIVMDDFGTGYSSINYLTYIPVDHIKLDKSLSDKFLKLENIKVIHSIILLAHSLNLTITAEGVEEYNQYVKLKEGGCDYIQGYYFSKPLEVEKAEEIYNKNLLDVR